MRRTVVVALVATSLAALISTVGGARFGEERRQPSLDVPQPDAAIRQRVDDTYGRLPLAFEANVGQTDAEVAFTAAGSGYRLFLTPTDAVLALQPSSEKTSRAAVRLSPVAANPEPEVVGLEPLAGKVNYLRGSDTASSQREVPTYAKVAQRDVWDGIDLVYYGNQGSLEYDMVVAPGAEPGEIRLAMQGAERLSVAPDGSLAITTAAGVLTQRAPVAYQHVGSERRPVTASYVLTGHTVGLRVGSYDRDLPLVIDPVLAYATSLGGPDHDWAYGITVDSRVTRTSRAALTPPTFPPPRARWGRATPVPGTSSWPSSTGSARTSSTPPTSVAANPSSRTASRSTAPVTRT